MSLGYDLEKDVTALGDTANLRAYLDNSHGEKLDPSDVLSVIFVIQAPDGTQNTYQGIVEDNGAGCLQYNDTGLEGHYVAVATFTLADGSRKSTRTSFEVEDPFTEPLLLDPTDVEMIGQAVWHKLEDQFDSEDGGPWLRQMTLRHFNPSKMAYFIQEALFDFNVTQPMSSAEITDFTQSTDPVNSPNPMFPLLVEGTLLAVIRHLMRSYTEQPLPQGGQITYEDRRDYLARYQSIYQIESDLYARWVSMAKRAQFGFGKTAQSLFSYSRPGFGLNYRWARGAWGPWGW